MIIEDVITRECKYCNKVVHWKYIATFNNPVMHEQFLMYRCDSRLEECVKKPCRYTSLLIPASELEKHEA